MPRSAAAMGAGVAAVAVAVTLVLAGCTSSGSVTSTAPVSAAASSRTPLPSDAPVGTKGTTAAVTAEVGGSPCGVAVTQTDVWVSDAAGATLARLDPATGVVRATTPLDDKPCEILLAAGSLWVVTQSGVLDRVDPATGAVRARIPVGEASYEAAYAAGHVWVTNRGSGTVSKVDPRTDTVVATVAMPIDHPGGLVALGRELWIGDDDSAGSAVVVYDTRSGRTRAVQAGARPAYVTTSAGLVWVSLQGESAVARVDPRTSKVLGTTPAGATPVNLAGSAGPSPQVWVPDDAGDVVTRIDARSGAVIETIPTGSGSGPAVAAVSPAGGAWVTGFAAGVVWWFRPSTG